MKHIATMICGLSLCSLGWGQAASIAVGTPLNIFDNQKSVTVQTVKGPVVITRTMTASAKNGGTLQPLIPVAGVHPVGEIEILDALSDRNALVVRAGHPILAQADALHPALATYPWLVLSECVQLERALRALVRKRGTPFNNSVIRTDSFHFFRSTLTTSDCIGLTRYDAARPETEAGNVVELPLEQAKLLGKP